MPARLAPCWMMDMALLRSVSEQIPRDSLLYAATFCLYNQEGDLCGKEGQAVTENELYRRYLAGDASAGDQLMLRLGDALTAYLNAFLHNAQDAEDIMLDCFTVILVNKPAIADGAFRAYLFKTGRNKVHRYWRLRFRRQEFSLDESLPSADASPEAAIQDRERDRLLHSCLNRIAPQYREALYLVVDQGLSYAQAASLLGCKTKKVEDLLKKGRKRLRLELAKEGITREDL